MNTELTFSQKTGKISDGSLPPIVAERTVGQALDSIGDDRAQERFTIGLALIALGHKEPGKIIDRAQDLADRVADAECNGIDWETEFPDGYLVEDFQTYAPALWEYVIAGHIGGGSSQEMTDREIEGMQFQPTEKEGQQ